MCREYIVFCMNACCWKRESNIFSSEREKRNFQKLTYFERYIAIWKSQDLHLKPSGIIFSGMLVKYWGIFFLLCVTELKISFIIFSFCSVFVIFILPLQLCNNGNDFDDDKNVQHEGYKIKFCQSYLKTMTFPECTFVEE